MRIHRFRCGSRTACTLEALLEAEAHVSRCVREGREPGIPPNYARTPNTYARRPPGTERARCARPDLWDRLQLADGLFLTLLRLLAACAVLAPLFWADPPGLERVGAATK